MIRKNLRIPQHCCDTMRWHAEYRCDQHPNPYDCGDNVISYDSETDSYGLIIHDGTRSDYSIQFCPWCGQNIKTKRKIKRQLRRVRRPSRMSR